MNLQPALLETMSLPRPTQPVENLHTTLSTSQDLLVSKVTDDGDGGN